jgi:RNA polymerase sigma-70 factor, ECF subfamily
MAERPVSAVTLPRVGPVNLPREPGAAAAAPSQSRLDPESRAWLDSLRAEGAERDEAIARLHALLLRAARFEAGRRRAALPHVRGDELDDIATEAADDALMSVLRRLADFRGASRFTTWAYKFALLEAAVKLRQRAWQGREVSLEPDTWQLLPAAGAGPAATVEQTDLLRRCAGRSTRR